MSTEAAPSGPELLDAYCRARVAWAGLPTLDGESVVAWQERLEAAREGYVVARRKLDRHVRRFGEIETETHVARHVNGRMLIRAKVQLIGHHYAA